jgi:arabinogalactan oligomer/maltooligosaccharide transport system permease protein
MSIASKSIDRVTVETRSSRAGRQQIGTWLIRLGMIVLCIVVLLPAFWVVTASVQPGSSAFSSSLFPTAFTWSNYQKIFDLGFWTWLRNSLVLCTATGLIQLTVNAMGAYAFSRLRFKGRRFGLMALLVIQMFPQMLGLAAIYGLLIRFNLLDTIQGIVLVYIGGSAFNMWLLKNYMDSLPRELDESAYVDGANSWRIFWSVLLPLMRPMLVTIFIFGFSGIYNDFIFSSLILQTPDHFTIAVGLFRLINGQYSTNWAVFAAGSVLASLPVLVIFLSLQRQLVSGLAQGAVKG